MSRVLVTLDFDGVVSPIDHDRDFDGDPNFEVFKLAAFRCAIARGTLDFLRYLKDLSVAQPERFSVIWATSWGSITEHFEQSTGGLIPQLDYLELNGSKARAIADAAIEKDASLILVFEDHAQVKRELKALTSRDRRLDGRQFIYSTPALKEGIQFADILEAKSLITAELSRGE